MATTAAEALVLGAERREKRRVALVSVAACAALLAMKAVVGLASNSLGVLSEALHSGLDLIATVITYFSIRVSDKPADADHQYGHGKIENFGALLETALLLIACAWIVGEAFERLLRREAVVEPSLVTFTVLLLTMGIDYFRSRALARVARKYDSQALEADALHFSADLWTTLVVLLGLAAVGASTSLEIGWLRHADPVAALIVAVAVVYIGLRLGKRSVEVLLDAAPAGLRAQVAAAAAGVAGVLSVDRVRTRRAGNRYFVDVTIAVARASPFEHVHAVSERVEAAVQARLPQADVVVHMEPRAATTEDLFDAIRAIALRQNLAVHDLAAHEVLEPARRGGRLLVDLHLEVEERLTLRQAHDLADTLEQAIYRDLPAVAQANIHIETLARHVAPAAGLDDLARQLEAYLREARPAFREIRDCHDIQVRLVEGKIVASCHATFDGALAIPRVHDITQELEARARARFPQLFRLTIHPEPSDVG